MIDLFTNIQQAAALAIKDEFDVEINPGMLNIQETRKEFEGDFTLVVFPLTKFRLGSPPQIGEKLGKLLQERVDYIESYNVIKGFLNLSLSSDYWLSFLETNQHNDHFLRTEIGKGKKVVVEYCSPNTNKPLHLGHLRNIILGYSTAQIMKANGFETNQVCLFNDRGTAICKSIYAWQQSGKNETPESSGKKGDLLVGDYYVEFSAIVEGEVQELIAGGMSREEAEKAVPSNKAINEMLIKWEANDPEIRALWRQMNGWVYEAHEHTFERLGVSFDKFYYESDIYQLGKNYVEEGVESGAFYQKEDGSIWVDLTEDGLDHKLLLRSNGTSVYITQDIAGAEVRYDDFGMDRSIYVVGNEQDYHFKVLFLILKKLGKSYAPGLHHLSYGMVDLPTGKMKSREGTRVDADDLMDQMLKEVEKVTNEQGKTEGMSESELSDLYRKLSLGALKFFLAKVDPKKRMLFNPEESVDLHGHTGPYIQYAYTRTAALKRKAELVDLPIFAANAPLESSLTKEERQLMKQLLLYPNVLQEAADSYNPASIANFAYELATAYNKFYAGGKILDSEKPHTSAFRFGLSTFAGKLMEESMRLLGIDMPDQM